MLNKPKKLQSKRRYVRRAAGAALIAAAALLLIGAWWVSSQDINKLGEPLHGQTLLFDRNGGQYAALSSSKIIPVPLAEIPKHLVNAVVAVEDKRFYEHEGVDLSALGRAAVRNIRAGGVVEGGSTITQQLAKNVLLNADRTMARKLKEAAMAVKIELVYDKDEILEMYMNQIYFGEGAWGVEQAARVYFGKSAAGLGLAESALLAALPKAPSHYSPYTDEGRALERRNLVLQLMAEQGYITADERKQAQAEPIRTSGEREAPGRKYPYYVDYVLQEAEETYGLTERELLSGEYRIYTHLDPKVQEAVEQVYADNSMFPEQADDIPVQSGAVVSEPSSGAIRGLVGGRGGQVYRGLNRASQIRRQPGSAFKPISVYAPALAEGYKADSRLYDGELDIGGYRPRNYDGSSRGEVSLKEALVHSYNVPAVWLLNEIGLGKGWDYAMKAGFKLLPEDRNLSLALGGLQQGVSPLELGQAYGAFANGGMMMESHAIVRIENKAGTVIGEASPAKTRLLSENDAYTMTLLLEEAVKSGTGTRAALERPAAGKTGTTQLPDTEMFQGLDGSKDIWFAGYTPELAAAIWMGYDKTDADHYMQATGGTYPAVLFQRIMSLALAGEPVRPFPVPDGYDPYLAIARESKQEDKGNKKDKVKEKDKKENEEREENRKDNGKKEAERSGRADDTDDEGDGGGEDDDDNDNDNDNVNDDPEWEQPGKGNGKGNGKKDRED
ncbi:transglycosylase domain-containing protein [Paenibacillus tarimensis]|uniref:transglycosylase domain-containing protein n=1 Tax=Paenibacillus tarimensis TaxID=416012 RepID=UPI001F20749F|nr:PBP1A family penicillin-binding protein [Paenibacillus tarimensis]MCF2944948.1 PBP1A family penicillin-binding protein [Paenibacillus tarimensis]